MICCGSANAATGASPRGFAGIPFGASVAQLRAVNVKSPAAFDFYRGRLIGAQILLTTSTAPFWLENSKSNYGPPDTCTYCESPDMASAQWKWADGTSVLIDGGGMLNIYTAEGQQQHTAWTARGEEKGAPLATAPPPAVAA